MRVPPQHPGPQDGYYPCRKHPACASRKTGFSIVEESCLALLDPTDSPLFPAFQELYNPGRGAWLRVSPMNSQLDIDLRL
jgi:hypothetical protein